MKRFLRGVRLLLGAVFICCLMAGTAGAAAVTGNSGAAGVAGNVAEQDIAVAAAEPVYKIYVHKVSHILELYRDGELYKSYGCATGMNTGDKQRPGDHRTPFSWGYIMASIPGAEPWTPSEYVPFVVDEVVYAGHWTHDFGDGKGEIAGAYGPWFISLNTGWDGIGIHGTHDENSIGTNASEGCIRLRNADVQELKDIICQVNGGIGVQVVISED